MSCVSVYVVVCLNYKVYGRMLEWQYLCILFDIAYFYCMGCVRWSLLVYLILWCGMFIVILQVGVEVIIL